MNVLSFKTDNYQYLCFELLVDGEPLGELVGSQNTYFPYWIVEDDLPYYPPHSLEHRESKIHIVSVCDGCGEYGCGHTRCKILRNSNEIVFSDFYGELSSNAKQQVFHFSVENYESVVSEIVKLAKEEQLKDKSKKQSQ